MGTDGSSMPGVLYPLRLEQLAVVKVMDLAGGLRWEGCTLTVLPPPAWTVACKLVYADTGCSTSMLVLRLAKRAVAQLLGLSKRPAGGSKRPAGYPARAPGCGCADGPDGDARANVRAKAGP